jgi:hypothetical protein
MTPSSNTSKESKASTLMNQYADSGVEFLNLTLKPSTEQDQDFFNECGTNLLKRSVLLELLEMDPSFLAAISVANGQDGALTVKTQRDHIAIQYGGLKQQAEGKNATMPEPKGALSKILSSEQPSAGSSSQAPVG